MTVLPIRPMHNSVFIDIVDRNVTMKDLGNGKVLHLLPDDGFGHHDPMSGKHHGARPRWARVLEIGPEVDQVQPGDLVLCDTLKWSRKIPLGRIGFDTIYFWRIAVDDILLVDDRDDQELYLRDVKAQMSKVEIAVGHF